MTRVKCLLLGLCLVLLVVAADCLLLPGNLHGAGDAEAPKLNLTHRNSFVVYPADCNHMDTLFGGKILAEMDRCSGITVRRLLYASATAKSAVTVSVDSVKFTAPGRQGDLIHVAATVSAMGKKSVTVDVLVSRETAGGLETIASGRFVFVAYDPEKKTSVEHGLTLPAREE